MLCIVIIKPSTLLAQGPLFSVNVTHDIEYPTGYCDIITFTIHITNLGSASTFTGRIEVLPLEWEVIDYADLPGSNILYNQGGGSWTHITFATPSLANNQTVSYEYQLVLQSFYDYGFHTINKVTRTSGLTTITVTEFVNYDIIKPIPYPGYSSTYASDLIYDFENGGQLTLIPVDPPLSDPTFYACHEDEEQTLYVQDELIFDLTDYCIHNDDELTGYVIIEDGGQIIIENGATLRVYDQSFTSCNKMWKGFYVENGGTLILENCTIENAQYGIHAEPGSRVSAIGTIFKDNYIGLYAVATSPPDPEGPTGAQVILHPFRGNQFYGTGTMLPPYSGQSPTPLDLPYAGVYVQNLHPFILPGQSDNPNIFENMQNGIVVQSSTAEISHAYFKDIESDPAVLQKIKGYGVYFDRCTDARIYANKGGFASYSHNFDNCHVGVYCNKGNFDASYLSMNNVQTGIHLNGILNSSIAIHENDIFALHKGLLLNHCALLFDKGIIEYNDIEVSGDGDEAVCIEMNDLPLPTGWVVRHNNLTLGDGVYAISSTGGYQSLIANNTITKDYYTEDDGYGIYLGGAKESEVLCNVLLGDVEGSNYHNSAGIYASAAHNFNISCNEIADFRYGLFAAGESSSQSALQGNEFGDNWIGLFMNESAVIGVQEHHGNIWDGTFDEFGAKNLAPTIIAQQSKFLFDSGDNSLFEPPSISSAPNWFDEESGTSYLCALEETCPDGVGYLGVNVQWNELDQDLVAGDLGFDEFDAPQSWMGRFHTYHRLKDTTGLGLPGDISSFISAQSSLNIGKFSNALDSIRQALRYTGALLSDLEDYPSWTEQGFETISYLDSLLLTGRNDDSLLTEIRLQHDTLFYLAENQLDRLESIEVLQTSRLTNAENYIKTISPDSAWQVWFKFVLGQAVHLSANDTLQESDLLYDVAVLCPERYGDAVFIARSLIRQDSSIVKYDDITSCDSLVTRSVLTNYINKIDITPNPAYDMITIYPGAEWATVMLVNSSGKEMETFVNDKSIRIESGISHLPAGIYFVVIRFADGNTMSKPFVKL